MRGLSRPNRRTVVNRPTTVGKALVAWRSKLLDELGGTEAVSTQELALVEEAVKTKLILDSVNAWLLTQRRVDMSERLGAVLRDLLVWRSKQKLRRKWAEMLPRLFFNDRQQLLDTSRVRKHCARALKRVRFSGFRVYDLRHSYATQLLARGAPITYVSAQLGHAKPRTTLQ